MQNPTSVSYVVRTVPYSSADTIEQSSEFGLTEFRVRSGTASVTCLIPQLSFAKTLSHHERLGRFPSSVCRDYGRVRSAQGSGHVVQRVRTPRACGWHRRTQAQVRSARMRCVGLRMRLI